MCVVCVCVWRQGGLKEMLKEQVGVEVVGVVVGVVWSLRHVLI